MSLCTTKCNPEDGEGSLHTERSQPGSRGCKTIISWKDRRGKPIARHGTESQGQRTHDEQRSRNLPDAMEMFLVEANGLLERPFQFIPLSP